MTQRTIRNANIRFLHVVGARPNFMKLAPLVKALQARSGIEQYIVHTGQHYDTNMSDIFFEELEIPHPDLNLGIGSGTHAHQLAHSISKLEPIVAHYQPTVAIVYGDVNAALAASIVCVKLNIHIAHVEAGLRSFDRSMPEEVNRVIIDRISDLLFTPSVDADHNLINEGISSSQIYFVGNIMIDTLKLALSRAEKRPILTHLKLQNGRPFALVTLHRPSNVDENETFARLINALTAISKSILVVFPVHPRTKKQIVDAALNIETDTFKLIEPLSYLDFLCLQKNATLVITDSGGVQEETTYLGVPCLTIRTNTERPITVNIGTNTLIGQDTDRLGIEVDNILNGVSKHGQIPLLWDGKAADRITEILCDYIE